MRVYTGGTGSRFDAKVDRSGSCHFWTGAVDKNTGYGQFNVAGKCHGAHRIALEAKLGRAIRPGMQANHTCDNRRCVNPKHLYEGTQAENIRDSMARGHHIAPPRNDSPPPVHIGEANTNAVMTEDKVRHLRAERVLTGASYKTLSERWGISRATVAQIVRRVTWKEVVP